MATIYLAALKKAISKLLSARETELVNQQKPFLSLWGYTVIPSAHKKGLSTAQGDIIYELKEAISDFKGSLDDAENTQGILTLILAAKKEIEEARAEYQKVDSGHTLPTLINLATFVPAFLERMRGLDVELPKSKDKLHDDKVGNVEGLARLLLNRQVERTPESIVYRLACSYVCNIVLEPEKHTDVVIRDRKLLAIANRLLMLEGLLAKQKMSLPEKKANALQILRDLNTDNNSIVQFIDPTSMPSVSLPGVGTLNAPTQLANSSPGYLKELIKAASSEIKKTFVDVATSSLPADEGKSHFKERSLRPHQTDAKKKEIVSRSAIKDDALSSNDEEEVLDEDAPSKPQRVKSLPVALPKSNLKAGASTSQQHKKKELLRSKASEQEDSEEELSAKLQHAAALATKPGKSRLPASSVAKQSVFAVAQRTHQDSVGSDISEEDAPVVSDGGMTHSDSELEGSRAGTPSF